MAGDAPGGGAVSLDDTVAPNAVAGAPAAKVASERYDPARDRERKRGQIATWLIALLAAITLAPFVLILARGACVLASGSAAEEATGICAGLPVVDLMAVLQLIVTPVVALVGAATGFYFGEKSGDADG